MFCAVQQFKSFWVQHFLVSRDLKLDRPSDYAGHMGDTHCRGVGGVMVHWRFGKLEFWESGSLPPALPNQSATSPLAPAIGQALEKFITRANGFRNA